MEFDAKRALEGEIDLEAASAYDERFRNDGFLFRHAVELLGEERYDALRASLREYQVGRRYLPRERYPTADYVRVSYAAALLAYPRHGSREALRLWTRDDIRHFAATTLGRVMLQELDDPKDALLALPEVYAKTTSGAWELHAEPLADDLRAVRLRFAELPREPAALLGRLEGLVLSYDELPRVELSPAERSLVVRW